ncbi:actin binding protein [Pelomyxa schiedti]|nr:actin binding protein [Pelomyxa schiedti]
MFGKKKDSSANLSRKDTPKKEDPKKTKGSSAAAPATPTSSKAVNPLTQSSSPATTPAEPRPSDEKIIADFAILLPELGIPVSKQTDMLKLPVDSKWKLLQQMRTKKVQSSPQYFMQELKTNPSDHLMKELRVSLTSETVSWVTNFLKLDGLVELINLLDALSKRKDKTPQDITLLSECILCLKALANNEQVTIENLPKWTTLLAQSLVFDLSADARCAACYVLASFVYHSDGKAIIAAPEKQLEVLKALDAADARKGSRWVHILKAFKKTEEEQLAAMTLLNSLVTDQEELTTRLILRKELEDLGITALLQAAQASSTDAKLVETITMWDDARIDDAAANPDLQDADISDPTALFSKLLRIVEGTVGGTRLHSLLSELYLSCRRDPDHGLKALGAMVEVLKTNLNIQSAIASFEVKDTIDNLNNEITRLKASNQHSEQQAQSAKEKLAAAYEKIQALEEEVQKWKHEVESRKREVHKLTSDMSKQTTIADHIGKQLAAEKEHVAQLQEEQSESATRESALAQKVALLEAEHKSLVGRVHTLEGDLRLAQEAKKQVEDEVSGLEQKLQLLSSEMKQSGGESGESGFSSQERIALQTDNSILSDKLKNISEELKKTQTLLQEARKDQQAVEEESKRLTTKLKALESQVSTGGSVRGSAPQVPDDFDPGQLPPAPPIPGDGAPVPPPPPPPPPPPMKGRRGAPAMLPPPELPPVVDGADSSENPTPVDGESQIPPPPPPPGGDGAPPPPPPPPPGPMGRGRGRGRGAVPPGPGVMAGRPPKVCEVPPSCKMLQLNLKKVTPEQINNTVWENAKEPDIKTLLPQIELLFAAKTAAVKTPGTTPEPEKSGPVAVKLLDGKKSNNVSITIGRIKIPFSDVVTAIFALDETVLTPSFVSSVLKVIPTPEEIETLRAYPDPPSTLDKPEQFLLEIAKVPRLQQRLDALSFQQQFQDKMNEVEPMCKSVVLACQQLVTSKKLITVMEFVLAIGNFVNANSFRGGLYGFKMDSLLQLSQTKSSSDPKQTFMHFIIDALGNQSPELPEWWDEVSAVDEARKVSLTQLASDVAGLRKGVKLVQTEIEAATSEDPMDKFKDIMTVFFKTASDDFTRVETAFKEAEEAFKKVLVFFCEDPKTTPEEFFGTVNTFHIEFEKAKKDIKLIKEKAIKDKQREAQAQARASGSAPASPGGAGPAKGKMDNLISSLQSRDRGRGPQMPNFGAEALSVRLKSSTASSNTTTTSSSS